MACSISFQDHHVWLSNRQFSSVISLALEVALEEADKPSELAAYERLKKFEEEALWPGAGLQIESDFQDLSDRKFWARVFFNLARAIFERRVGHHEYHFWQAQRISHAYSIAQLFVTAVKVEESEWEVLSLDHIEFEAVVNGNL